MSEWRPCKPGEWYRQNGTLYEIESVERDLAPPAAAVERVANASPWLNDDRPSGWHWTIKAAVVADRSLEATWQVAPDQTGMFAASVSVMTENGRYGEHTGDHYPVCATCGDVWPCWHRSAGVTGRYAFEQLDRKQAYEAAHPHACPWCARLSITSRRFKTARGVTVHDRTCKHNPLRWNLAAWVPHLRADLRVAGGFNPGGIDGAWCPWGPEARDRMVATAQAVMLAALTAGGPDGLPATLAEVPGVPTGGEDNTW